MQQHRGASVAGLASALGVCSAAWATLRAGRVQAVHTLSGCPGQAAPTADAVFQAASLTKPLLAWAVLRQVLAGRLDLQAPVSHWLPAGYRHFHSALARGPADASDTTPAEVLARIPLASLLSHSSGLPHWSRQPLQPSFVPGSRWQYSGEGYQLLQAVLEAATGQPLDTWLQDQLFSPQGMAHTRLAWHPALAERLQAGQPGPLAPPPVRWPYPVGAASLYTSAGDYARFLATVLADAALLALTTGQTVPVAPSLGLQWGLGWGLAQHPRHGPLLWHWGNNPGYRAFTMLSPRTGDGLVLLTAHHRGMALAVPLAEALWPGEHPVFGFHMLG